MGLSALVHQHLKNPDLENNKENYEDVLKKFKDAVDKAKKDLLSGNTSDKVDLKNGKNTDEAIMKFAKESEDKQKKALEELFKNLAKEVTDVFKNHSNSSSENAQLAKDQIPVTNADGTSQTEKTQTDKTDTADNSKPSITDLINKIKTGEATIPDYIKHNGYSISKYLDKYNLDSTQLFSEEDKKDPAYAVFDKLSEEEQNNLVKGFVTQLINPEKVTGKYNSTITLSSKSFINYLRLKLQPPGGWAMQEALMNAGNYNKPTNSTQNVPPILDVPTKIKQLETQLASMQEAYEKYQPKGLKEQIDKVQAELDKLRNSVANAPQPPELAGVDTALPANWTYGDPDKQTENPQPPVINAEDTSLLEKTQTSETNTDAEPLPADFKMPTQIPAEENEIPADKTQTDKTDKTQTNKTDKTDKTQTNKTDKTVIDLIDAIRAGKKTDGKYSLDSTPLWSEEDKKDPIYERFNQLSAKDKSGMVSDYVQTIRDNVNGSAKIKISFASFKDYVSFRFASRLNWKMKIADLGRSDNIKRPNSNQTSKTTTTNAKATDVETRIKQLETQLASMQEAYEKYQPKGLKEQIDKVQAELDKLRALRGEAQDADNASYTLG